MIIQIAFWIVATWAALTLVVTGAAIQKGIAIEVTIHLV